MTTYVRTTTLVVGNTSAAGLSIVRVITDTLGLADQATTFTFAAGTGYGHRPYGQNYGH